MVPYQFHASASALEEHLWNHNANPFSQLDLEYEREEFTRWAANHYRPTSFKKEVLSYTGYIPMLKEPEKLSYIVSQKSMYVKLHILKVLNKFSKYLDSKYNTDIFSNYFNRMRKLIGLKWTKPKPLPSLRKLNINVEEVAKYAIRKMNNYKYQLFALFMLATGLRTESEAYVVFKNFDEYYLEVKGIHLVELMMDRKTKKAFFALLPPRLVEELKKLRNRRLKLKAVREQWNKAVSELGLDYMEYPLYTLRKLHATLLKRYMSESDVDLLQGRIPSSVLGQFYNLEHLDQLYKNYMLAVGRLVEELLDEIKANRLSS